MIFPAIFTQMQSPSDFPGAYEALFLKEKEKNSLLLSRIAEKEALIQQLHAANDEAYATIHALELKIRDLQALKDELSRISLQKDCEISALNKQLSRFAENSALFKEIGASFKENGADSAKVEPFLRNNGDFEHKKLKYMTLGNEKRDFDGLFFENFKENEVERLRHQLKVFEKFHESLAKAVLDCSPPNTYKLRPTLKEIWKWIRKLIEEYMVLKTQLKE